MKRTPYVGITRTGAREVFHADQRPTEATHGRQYIAVIGPFYTLRAARFMRDHGRNNPHLQTVCDAERYAAACALEDAARRKQQRELLRS